MSQSYTNIITEQSRAEEPSAVRRDGKRIGLFIPCYIDAFFPEVGIATLELLEKLGCSVGQWRQCVSS